MKLALAMIVRDEEEVLERCLSSCHTIFDKIYITDTGSKDRTIEIAEKYGKVSHFEWIDDFGAARNFSFAQVEEDIDWVMWIDADDVIKPEDLPRFEELKKALAHTDKNFVRMPYYYSQDEKGNPNSIVPLDRIVRKSKNYPWSEAIHECLVTTNEREMLEVDIPIWHYRTATGIRADDGRNLRILKKAVEKEGASSRVIFYYGKDLHAAGQYAEAIPHLKKFLEDKYVDPRYAMEALFRLAECLEKDGDIKQARKIALSAVNLDWRWVEPYIVLARAALGEKKHDEAEHWARAAMRLQPIDNYLFLQPEAFTIIPRSLLVLALGWSCQYEEADKINKELLEMQPGNPMYLHNEELFAGYLGRRRAPKDKPLRLNLGCGNKRIPEFWNCDAHPMAAVDEVFDLSKIPYGNDIATEIRCEYALEHLEGQAARRAVQEWARVLEPGGYLYLLLPDLKECCRRYASATDPDQQTLYRHAIYGQQVGLWGEPHEAEIHKTGFSPDEISGLLTQAGFVLKSVSRPSIGEIPSMEIQARKAKSSIKVTWLCADNREAVQPRLRGLHIVTSLRESGYHVNRCDAWSVVDARSNIVVANHPFIFGSKDAVVSIRQSGRIVVADLCEDLFGIADGMEEDLRAYDLVVCSSHVLADKVLQLGVQALVIEDCSEVHPRNHCDYEPKEKLKVVWCGYGGGKGFAEELRPTIEKLGMELVTIHEHEGATHPWRLDSWQEQLAACDIAIAPMNPEQQAKGQVKVAQYLGAGLPTIVGPLDSYRRLVTNGITGFVAHTPEDWERALRKLQDAPVREAIGRAGHMRIQGHTIEAMAEKWWAVFERLMGVAPDKAVTLEEEPVPVVVTAYNCLEYTKLCVESLRECRGEIPYQIYISDAGSSDGTQKWVEEQEDLTLLGGERRRCFSEVVNLGIRSTQGEFVCVLNNDLLVSKGWLDEMVRVGRTKPQMGSIGVLSNCDRGWLYPEQGDVAREMVVDGTPLTPKMRLGSVDPGKVMEWGRQSNERLRGEIIERTWVAFYAVLLRREAIEKVGALDEEFKTGGEDLDYCRRLSRAGYKSCQAYGSFVFHWGAVSREHDERERYDEYHKEDSFNIARVNEKEKPQIAIYTGGAWERWSPASIDQGGIGGSETCAYKLAQAFTKKGWRAVVFADCEEKAGVYDGVDFRDYRTFSSFADMNWIDLLVSSRTLDPLLGPVRADMKVVWVHDIWLSYDASIDIRPDLVDYYAVLSPWHRDYFKGYHNAPEDKLWVVPDGVDVSRFTGLQEQRNPHRMHYSSSPDRGLWVLLNLFPEIRKEIPDAELHVYYGFDNWDKAVAIRNEPNELAQHADIKKLLQQPGVTAHGRVGQDVLAREFMKSNIWAYPTWFWETFCLTAVESMLAGAIPVTANLAGLQTTVGYDHGVVIERGAPHYPQRDHEFEQAWLAKALEILKHPEKFDELRERNRAYAAQFDWSGVAELWISKFKSRVGSS